MKTAMYDARDSMMLAERRNVDTRYSPGEFDRRPGQGSRNRETETTSRSDRNTRHDPLTYIGPERLGSVPPANLPIPVGIFMNMAHVPPRFYNQHQQLMAQAAAANKVSGPPPSSSAAAKKLGVGGKGKKTGLSQGNSQLDSQPYSQGPFTQAGLSQGGGLSLSQGGLSQDQGLSQDSLMIGDMHSQLDGLLSQDSTYQGDRFNGQLSSQQHSQYLSQFSQH